MKYHVTLSCELFTSLGICSKHCVHFLDFHHSILVLESIKSFERKLDRNIYLMILYNVCVFVATAAGYRGPLWSWSYGSLIYNNLCNQCLSSLMFRVRTQVRPGVLDTTLCDKVCQWLATGLWFSPGTPVSSTNKTECNKYNWNIVESGINTTTLTHAGYIFKKHP